MPALVWMLPLAASLLGQTEPSLSPNPNPPQDPSTISGAAVLAAVEDAITGAVAKAQPSVVALTVERAEEGDEILAVHGRVEGRLHPPPPNRFSLIPQIGDRDYVPVPGDFASGVVVGPGNKILTTYHVLKGAMLIHVRAPGTEGFFAEVIAADPRSDLAVIAPVEVPGEPIPDLPPLPLGKAEELKKGSFLIALGNPYNSAFDGEAAAALGILSNTSRRLTPPLERNADTVDRLTYHPTLMQLDTKLNLGMSGGAVINMKGELVGVTTTGSMDAFDANAGYAFPIDVRGRRAVERLREGREVEYGFLGIGLDDAAANRVGNVFPGTPADQGGLIVGDTIVEVDGIPTNPLDGLSLALSNVPVGEPVKLKVLRDGKFLNKQVFVSKYPVSGQVIATSKPEPWRGIRVEFTSALAGSTFSQEILQAMARGCVSIIEVQPGSPAAKAGLRKDQVIIQIDGQPVRSPDQFARAVEGKTGPVTLTTERGDVTIPAPE